MQVAGQPQVVYGWDNANRLTGITQGSSAVGINYDNANRRTSLTLPNGVTVGYGFDNDSRITGLTYSAGSTQLGNLTYGYDADGRVTSKNGTLAAISLPNSVSGNTFNADNGMTGFGGATLTYDANGNLTNDGTNTYTWDARNHLTAISGAAAASFTYDAFSRRASKTIAGASTQFLYDWRNPAQELQGGVPSANLLTGLRIDEYFARTDSSNNVSTLLPDALGSTIGLVGSGQNIATNYTYQPFGASTITGTANGNSYQFTGRENDGTGLYFYRARYYNPTFQRFIAQDPIGFGGGDTNLYAYVWNNPLSFLDPLGLLTSQEIGNIIFNETAPMSGPNISDARIDIGHAIINGSEDENPPSTAPDTVGSNLSPSAQQTLNACQNAAQQAVNQDSNGIDPTNGAEHFNLRTTNSTAVWTGANGGTNEAPSMILGPFDNSYNDYQYIDIYP